MKTAHKNNSLTPEQQAEVRKLHGTMFNKDLAEKIGVTYSKLMNNINLMDLKRKQPKVKPPVSFSKKIFSWDWAKYVDPTMVMV